jgi:hypothetical protein
MPEWNKMRSCVHRRQKDTPFRLGKGVGAPRLLESGLLLPGAFLVAVGAQLFAPFMFVDFAFATFF